MIFAFIEEQRTLGLSVRSICRVLREQDVRVAARTKHAQPSVRDVEDAAVIDAILSVRINKAGGLSPGSMSGFRKLVQHR